MKNHHTIAMAWKSLTESVIPKDAPIEQVIETKRAFYAGAHAMLTYIQITAELPMEEACKIMDGYVDEISNFCRVVGTPAEL